jgi:hypothetical protein
MFLIIPTILAIPGRAETMPYANQVTLRYRVLIE